MEIDSLFLDTTPTYNRSALIGIYEQHSNGLFQYAYRMLGDKELAEDCVSETFSRFLRVIRDGRGPTENLRAYLYRIAHNWVTDHYRAKPNRYLPLDLEMVGNPEENPAYQYSLEQQQNRVRIALMQLPPDQRRVIELRFLEQWSHEQVADAIGRSPEATRALQHRALNSLRRMLVQDEE